MLTNPSPPLVYTPEEARQLLKIGRSSMYEALRRGDVPSIRIGHRYLVPCHALNQLLAGGDLK